MEVESGIFTPLRYPKKQNIQVNRLNNIEYRIENSDSPSYFIVMRKWRENKGEKK